MLENNVTMDWVLTANGPGEISAQIKPMAKEIKRQYPQARITLIILPCQFASGYEIPMAQKIAELDRIISPKKYRELVFQKKALEQFHLAPKGAIIFLGGDPFHAILLKNRFKYPAFAYFEKKVRWAAKFKEVFTPKTVGNLMVDAAEGKINYGGHALGDPKLSVGLFPGSRPGYVEYMIPLLMEIAKKLKTKVPNINFCWGIPFHLKEFVNDKFSEELAEFPQITDCHDLDLILTLLGTNTALYAVQGIPMLVLFPFHRPDLIPLMGLLGLLDKVPIISKFIKWLALRLASFRLGHVAIPNIVSKTEITPEMKGYFKADDVVKKAYELLQDVGWRNRISGQLRFSIGKGGAAQKIVERIGKAI
ncbi:hypothetical protein ACFL5G_01760 [Candidatus Margulisiibacteriota bacterium]